MNNLEKKFYEYLKNNGAVIERHDELAHDLAEIAEKQIENYKEEVINVIEESALDIEFKSDNQELVDRINKINVRTK